MKCLCFALFLVTCASRYIWMCQNVLRHVMLRNLVALKVCVRLQKELPQDRLKINKREKLNNSFQTRGPEQNLLSCL